MGCREIATAVVCCRSMKAASLAVLLGFSLAANAVLAGPAGLEMGMTLAEVERAGTVVPGKSRHVYTLTRGGGRETGFLAYQLFITPAFGLCKIVAIGPSTSVTEVQSAFRDEEHVLAIRYGSPRQDDGEKPSNTLSSAYWYELGQGLMRDELRAVKLEANTLNAGRGYLSVAYEFRNFSDCASEDRESGQAGL